MKISERFSGVWRRDSKVGPESEIWTRIVKYEVFDVLATAADDRLVAAQGVRAVAAAEAGSHGVWQAAHSR